MRLSTEKNELLSSNRIRSALALVLLATLSACKGEAAVRQETVRPVKVAVIEPAPQGRTLTYSGVVRPRIETTLGFRVGGKIVERPVNVGDRISAEQVIARLDETDLRLAQTSASAAVASAQSRRDVAKDNLERAKALLPRAVISQAAYDTRQNELEAAEAALNSAQAQLRQAANAVGYATLVADKAGILTAVTAEPGQVVAAGQPVVSLARAGETEIAIAVPEQDAARLTVGQRAKVTLWAGPRVSIEGRIREIAGQADPASRTYAIRLAVKEPPENMRLGMTASVALRIEDQKAAVVIPLTALTKSDSGPVVYVVDAASAAVRARPVAPAGVSEDGVRIAAGLEAGDVVVTGGVQFLRDGMRVRIPDSGLQASSTGASGDRF